MFAVSTRVRAIVVLAAVMIAPISLLSENQLAPAAFNKEQNALPPAVTNILKKGERFILLSLDPNIVIEERAGKPAKELFQKELFHQYQVRRKVEIRTHEGRDELLRVLYKGIAVSEGWVAMCFNPRHGIRAVLGDETMDLVICFECFSIKVHGKVETQVLTIGSAAPTLNRALTRSASATAKPR